MAITYPITLSLAGMVVQADFDFVSSVALARSPFTFQEDVDVNQGMMWEATFAIRPDQERAGIEQLLSELISLNGQEGTFLAGDPLGATPRGPATGTPLVNGASQTGRTLVTDGWTVSQTPILRAGDYIQLGSGATTHLHKVLRDVNSDAGGNATLDIWPRLRSPSPSDNAPITVSNPLGIWRLKSNRNRWTESRAKFYGITFAAEEAL